MATIDAAPGTLEAFADDVPDDQPIALVNLLRFSKQAVIDGTQITGREAYERYVRALEPAIVAAGGRPIFRAQARTVLIGPSHERWDEVIVVLYPRRSAFEQLVRSPEYRSSAPIRTAALDDSRLIAATAPQRIRWVAWSLYKLAVRLRRE
jgi:uncharacterized protein (DUF1330 family)